LAGINTKYVYINFNSSLNSFYTLFVLIIVSSWNVISNMYSNYLGGNTVIRLFFFFYYTLGVQVVYNLVLASIIDHIIS